MIGLRDAITLAYTKLRTRRVRTAVTVVIASLLFGVIVFALLILQGGIDSVKRFTAGTLSERYLAMVTHTPQRSIGDPALPASVTERAQQIYNDHITAKKAAAKRLGVEYDATTEPKPTMKFDDMESLDPSSPAAIQAYAEYLKTLPTAQQEVDRVVNPYKPLRVYPITSGTAHDGAFKPMTDGKEDFTKKAEASPNMFQWGIEQGWLYSDQRVVAPFMLDDEQLKRQSDMAAIPVIAPVRQVEQALGLAPLGQGVSSKERLDRLKYVKANAGSATFTLCYRNTVSQQQVDDALRVAKEIERNKANKDYQRPSLVYGLPPAGDCAAAPVVRDVRTTVEKRLMTKQQEFLAEFGESTEPVQRKLTFRVVGLSPSGFSPESFSNIDGLLMTVAGSTLEGQWVVPRQMFEAMPSYSDLAPLVTTAASDDATKVMYDGVQQIVEFSSVAEVKRFVEKAGCGMMYCDPGRVSATYFGSNAVLIEDIRAQAAHVLGYVALAVAVIAGLIMMGMIGRVIGDSRRETAVFRAIGATRGDIRLVYTSYTLMLSAIVAMVSLLLGALAAYWLHLTFAEEFTVRAQLIYIFTEPTTRFDLVGIWWTALSALGGLVVVTGLVGMLLPLARNLARSPIKDMRDDT